jgi:hypothetical protein
MKPAGTILVLIGLAILFLFGEHWIRAHREYAPNEIPEAPSILIRIFLPEPETLKAPPREYYERLRERRRVGLLWINWGVPSLGALAFLGGMVLIVVGSARRPSRHPEKSWA